MQNLKANLTPLVRPQNLQVDEIVRIGQGSLGVMQAQPEAEQKRAPRKEAEGGMNG